jgi:chemotaxis protein histidine kinase CheA
LNLCKFADKTVRRGGASLLTKLSTLEDSKMRLCKEKGAVHLMLQMAKLHDKFIQFTAAQCLAELAEEPRNRRELLGHGVLPVFTFLARTGDPQTAFECARGMADLSEACDNRTIIVYTALRDILDMLRGDEDDVQENAARCLCNLIAPAGEVATAAYGEEVVTAVGRYGALKEVDDSASESESDSDESEYEYETVDEDADDQSVSQAQADSSGDASTDDEEPPDWFLGKVEMPNLEDTDQEAIDAAALIQNRWRAVQSKRVQEIRKRMKMASKIQKRWRLTKQREQQAKEEEEARIAAEEAEAEWQDVVMARAELEAAEKSGDQTRIVKAKKDLAREIAEAEEAQANAERERAEAEEAKAAAEQAAAEAAAAREAEQEALAKGRSRRPRPVTPPRKPGQKVLSAKTRRAISGRPIRTGRSKRPEADKATSSVTPEPGERLLPLDCVHVDLPSSLACMHACRCRPA